MAKDGTNRGGARIGAGRKAKSLNDKINEGKSAKVLTVPAELEGADVPPVREFLKAPQAKGNDLIAEDIFLKTYRWLKEHGCEKAVYPQIIELYAMTVARWIQAEELISATGFLAKHPTTGGAIASPYVTVSQSYMKQAQQVWYQIFQIVKENSSGDYSHTPMDDTMELLLSVRKGG
ncbi:MAG: P27 family phage terminase small subunit [Ruminococcus sp.]|nr:P27 family phage terminase small subunit [Ruminococcus sp.]